MCRYLTNRISLREAQKPSNPACSPSERAPSSTPTAGGSARLQGMRGGQGNQGPAWPSRETAPQAPPPPILPPTRPFCGGPWTRRYVKRRMGTQRPATPATWPQRSSASCGLEVKSNQGSVSIVTPSENLGPRRVRPSSLGSSIDSICALPPPSKGSPSQNTDWRMQGSGRDLAYLPSPTNAGPAPPGHRMARGPFQSQAAQGEPRLCHALYV